MTDVQQQASFLELSGLDALFLLLALVSLVVNILQWFDRRALRVPLSSNLRSLFQDIKTKEQNAYFVSNAIFHTNNPHTEIETVKWEYGLFAQSVLGNYQGFKEVIVGLLKTLNPKDKGDEITRALDYGMTDEEKALREEFLKNQQERMRQSTDPAGTAPDGAAGSDPSPESDPGT